MQGIYLVSRHAAARKGAYLSNYLTSRDIWFPTSLILPTFLGGISRHLVSSDGPHSTNNPQRPAVMSSPEPLDAFYPIIKTISDHIAPSEILTFRLLSKASNNAVQQRFLTHFFTELTVSTSRRSLDTLIEICKNPAFAVNVKRIDYVSGFLSDNGAYQAMSSFPLDRLKRNKNHHQYWREQEDLFRGTAIEKLTAAFRMLKSLGTSINVGVVDECDAHALVSKSRLNDDTSNPDRLNLEYRSGSALGLLAAAIVSSGCQTGDFCLDLTAMKRKSWDDVQGYREVTRDFLATVKTLRLTQQSCEPEDTSLDSRIRSLLPRLFHLQTLEIDMARNVLVQTSTGTPELEFFMSDLLAPFISNLRQLRFKRSMVKESDVVSFLQQCTALRILEFDSVLCPSRTLDHRPRRAVDNPLTWSSWPAIFQSILESPSKLDCLKVSNVYTCLYNESNDKYSIHLDLGGQASDFNDAESVISGLHELIAVHSKDFAPVVPERRRRRIPRTSLGRVRDLHNLGS